MKLHEIAHCRAGDKGDTSNLCVIAIAPETYPELLRLVTADAVKRFLGERIRGEVTRFELPQLQALNFVLTRSLHGGVTRSLAMDAHGKCLSGVLLGMELDEERD